MRERAKQREREREREMVLVMMARERAACAVLVCTVAVVKPRLDQSCLTDLKPVCILPKPCVLYPADCSLAGSHVHRTSMSSVPIFDSCSPWWMGRRPLRNVRRVGLQCQWTSLSAAWIQVTPPPPIQNVAHERHKETPEDRVSVKQQTDSGLCVNSKHNTRRRKQRKVLACVTHTSTAATNSRSCCRRFRRRGGGVTCRRQLQLLLAVQACC